ncbi:MAG: hypothetical protein QNL33_01960 [Akkermansiaceae bacterium]
MHPTGHLYPTGFPTYGLVAFLEPLGGSAPAEDGDEVISALKEADVKFKREPFETPVCHMAMVFDPAENIVIIHKRKPGHP